MKTEIATLRRALLDLTGVLNRPQPDAALITAAGVDLDRALFPLLARIELYGPIGVVELAELAGRDHTTVSRQVSKLVSAGLVARTAGAMDARVRLVTLTKKGLAVTGALDAARQQMVRSMMTNWTTPEVKQLAALLRRFADDAMRFAATLSD